jgi:hypothetical protein
MDGAGYYNEHSAQQLEAATAGVELLRRAAASVPLPEGQPLVIADLGSSEGRNSLAPLAAAIDTMRARPGGDVPIAVVHTDLPQNDFSSLFDVVATDPGSYRRDGVFTYVAGRSFYQSLFPPETLTLGWSSTAVLWLSSAPCELSDHLFTFMATGDQRARWEAQAAHDWSTFVALRAAELRPAAELVVTTLYADAGYVPWMGLVEAPSPRPSSSAW